MKCFLLLCIGLSLPFSLCLDMDKFLDEGCSSDNPKIHRDVEFRESCCKQLQFGLKDLPQYMKRMEEWNCSRLVTECIRQDYAYTPFSKSVYSRYCNTSNFRRECSSTLLGAFKYNRKNFSKEDPNSISDKMWGEMINPLGSISHNDGLFSEPCIQVATYDLPGNYEVVVRNLPICGHIYCRMELLDTEDGKVSSWTCNHTPRCRISAIVIISAFVIMSILIVSSNLIVIIVFLRNERAVLRSDRHRKKVKNSQSIYKISIAISDLAVGVFVCPGVTLMYVYVFLNTIKAAEYYVVLSLTASVSFCVSWLTLTIAGLDRLYAIIYPFKYCQHDVTRSAKMAVISIWLVCVCISILPFPLEANTITAKKSQSFVMIADDTSFISACCLLLIIVWSSGIAVYIAVKKHHKSSLELLFASGATPSQSMETQNAEIDKKLAITLCIMIGAFTISLLPTLVLHILSILGVFDDVSFATTTTLEAIALLILVSNSLWNCIVYNFRNKEFRNEVNSMLTFERKETVSSGSDHASSTQSQKLNLTLSKQ